MKSYENKFHLLAIDDQSFDTGKVYHQNFQGYLVTSANEKYIVFHKKQIKIVDLKEIGNSMGVIFLYSKREVIKIWLNLESFSFAWKLFSWFDEYSWEKYFYLPYCSQKQQEATTMILENGNFPFSVTQSSKWMLFQTSQPFSDDLQTFFSLLSHENLSESDLESCLSFLFALVILYGKFEVKNNELRSIKIHFPLFWSYLSYKDTFHQLILLLQQQGYFFQVSENVQWDFCSYQITSNDGEVLKIFAWWLQKDFVIVRDRLYQEVKNQFLDHLSDLSIENKEEMYKLFEESSLKVLEK